MLALGAKGLDVMYHLTKEIMQWLQFTELAKEGPSIAQALEQGAQGRVESPLLELLKGVWGGSWGHSLGLDTVMLGKCLELVILEVFSKFNDCVIL